MKKILFGLAVVALAVSSCSQNEEVSSDLTKKRAINFTAYTQLAPTRTVETTKDNLNEFKAVATRFGTETQVFYEATKYTKDASSVWKSSPEYLWPSYNLNFYAYNGFPTGKGTFTETITSSMARKLAITPATLLAEQTDLIAGTKFNAGPVDKTPITFNHILSRVSIQAKSSNANYVVKVMQAKLANLAGNGTFTYATPNAMPAEGDYTDNSCASGYYAGVTEYNTNYKNVEGSVDYSTTEGTAVTLGTTYQRMMFDGVSEPTATTQLDWYLIPQEFTAWEIASSGDFKSWMDPSKSNQTYIALKVSITTTKGAKVYPIGSAEYAWMAVPFVVADYQVPADKTTGAAATPGTKTNGISQGKNYVIKINFFSTENGGAGYSDPEAGEEKKVGDANKKGWPIINPDNKYIRFTPTVTTFVDGAAIEYNL